MIPAVLQKGGKKLPFAHSGMIPYVADYVTKVLNEELEEKWVEDGEIGVERRKWETEDVMRVARDNARIVYGI